MSANLEKTSRVRGIVVSALLHGIFIAGCLALDAGAVSTSSTQDHPVDIRQVQAPEGTVSDKS